MAQQDLNDHPLEVICITGHDLSLKVLPDLGGKISSLQWKGREVLAQNPYKPFRRALYAASFSDFDASGFDECFPTVGPCAYPEPPLQGVHVPDHGELWSIPWVASPFKNGLYLEVDGVHFPYHFERWIEIFHPGHLRLRYRVTNTGDKAFKALWSAHPLFAPRPGMVLHLPEAARVRVDWSRDGRLGKMLDEHTWPLSHDSSGKRVDLGRILPESAGLVDKLYTTRLSEGWCMLHDPQDGYYVALMFSPERIAYLGLSINLGGWPVDGPGYYNVGLEPCTGYPDRLDVAIQHGDCMIVPAQASIDWEWDLFVGQTFDLALEHKRLDGLL